MKHKRNTYLLLASVVIIWGVIIYKMIAAWYPDKKVVETETFFADFRPESIQQQDTFSISLHERDPFSGVFIKPEVKNMRVKKRRVIPKEEAPQIPVSFSGMIAGKTSKEHVFFVAVNNRQHVMKINDEIEQVKLVKGNAKAISIRYNNTLKKIPITQ